MNHAIIKVMQAFFTSQNLTHDFLLHETCIQQLLQFIVTFDLHPPKEGPLNNLPLPTLVESSAPPLQSLKSITNRDITCYSHKSPLVIRTSHHFNPWSLSRFETLLIIPTSNLLAFHLYQLHIIRINFGPHSPWFNTANTMRNCPETTFPSWLPKRDLATTFSPAGFTPHHCLHPGNLCMPCFQQPIEILYQTISIHTSILSSEVSTFGNCENISKVFRYNTRSTIHPFLRNPDLNLLLYSNLPSDILPWFLPPSNQNRHIHNCPSQQRCLHLLHCIFTILHGITRFIQKSWNKVRSKKSINFYLTSATKDTSSSCLSFFILPASHRHQTAKL